MALYDIKFYFDCFSIMTNIFERIPYIDETYLRKKKLKKKNENIWKKKEINKNLERYMISTIELITPNKKKKKI